MKILVALSIFFCLTASADEPHRGIRALRMLQNFPVTDRLNFRLDDSGEPIQIWTQNFTTEHFQCQLGLESNAEAVQIPPTIIWNAIPDSGNDYVEPGLTSIRFDYQRPIRHRGFSCEDVFRANNVLALTLPLFVSGLNQIYGIQIGTNPAALQNWNRRQCNQDWITYFSISERGYYQGTYFDFSDSEGNQMRLACRTKAEYKIELPGVFSVIRLPAMGEFNLPQLRFELRRDAGILLSTQSNPELPPAQQFPQEQ